MAQVHLAAANVSMLRRAPRKTRFSTALPVARRQP
jgi:hypothetical protein